MSISAPADLVVISLTRPDGDDLRFDTRHLRGATFSTSVSGGMDAFQLEFIPETVPADWYRPNTRLSVAYGGNDVWDGFLLPPNEVGDYMASAGGIGYGLDRLARLVYESTDTTEMTSGALLRAVIRAAAPGISVDESAWHDPQGLHRPLDVTGLTPRRILDAIIQEGSADNIPVDWFVWPGGRLSLTRRQPPAPDDADYFCPRSQRTRQLDESQVASHIRVAYTDNGVERLTDWGSNPDTANAYGMKHAEYRVGEMTAEAALQLRDTLLRRYSQPQQRIEIRTFGFQGLANPGGGATAFHTVRAGEWVQIEGDAEPRRIVHTEANLITGELVVEVDAEARTAWGILGRVQYQMLTLAEGRNLISGVKQPLTTPDIHVEDVRFSGGAKPDGNTETPTDNTVAFRLALEEGKRQKRPVHLGAGTYMVRFYPVDLEHGVLLRVYEDSGLIGQGMGKSIIKCLPESYEVGMFDGDSEPHAARGLYIERNTTLQGFTLDGSKDEIDPAVVRVNTNGLSWDETLNDDPADNVIVRDVEVKNIYTKARSADIVSIVGTTLTHDGSQTFTAGDEVVVRNSDAQHDPDGAGNVAISGRFIASAILSSTTFTLSYRTEDGGGTVTATVAGTAVGDVVVAADKDFEGFAIFVGGCNNADLENIWTHDNLLTTGVSFSGPALSPGVRPAVGGHRMRNVRSHDNGWQGVVCHRVRDVTVEGFEVYNNSNMGITSELSDNIVYRNGYSHDNALRGINCLGLSYNVIWDTIRLSNNGTDEFSGAEMGTYYNSLNGVNGTVQGLTIRNVTIESVGRRHWYSRISDNTNDGGSHLPSITYINTSPRGWSKMYTIIAGGTTDYEINTTTIWRGRNTIIPRETIGRLALPAVNTWSLTNMTVSASAHASMATEASPWKLTASAAVAIAATTGGSVPNTGSYLARAKFLVTEAGESWEFRLIDNSSTPSNIYRYRSSAEDVGSIVITEWPMDIPDRTKTYRTQIRYTAGTAPSDMHLAYYDIYEVVR